MEFKELIIKEYIEAKEYYPKLNPPIKNKEGLWEIRGDFDVLGGDGYCWATYSIKIVIPKTYPYEVPLLIETSNKIEKSTDWHNKDGVCCTSTNAKIFHTIGAPINLKKWLQVFVHSYFANHVVRLKEGRYPIGEYSHFEEGILEAYFEIFNTDSKNEVLSKISEIVNYRANSRNKMCKCGSGKKHKRCYLRNPKKHNFNIPLPQIIKDRKEIQNLI